MTDAIRPRSSILPAQSFGGGGETGKPAQPSGLGQQRGTGLVDFWPKTGLTRRFHETANDIGWITREGPPTTDVTAVFDALNARAMAGENILPENATRCAYLFTGGLFSKDVFLPATYMQENMDAVSTLKLEVGDAPVKTKVGLLACAEVERDAAVELHKKTKLPVMFVGHSMGGLIAGAAIAKYPEVAAITAGLCTWQSPWGGSPVAEDTTHSPLQLMMAQTIVGGIMRGDPACILDLRARARKEFLAKYPLPPGLNVVSVATTSAVAGAGLQALYGVGNDSVVVPSDALIPGSQSVVLNGLSHLATVCYTPGSRWKYTPASITMSTLTLALSKM